MSDGSKKWEKMLAICVGVYFLEMYISQINESSC
jgi:hypothetical protein